MTLHQSLGALFLVVLVIVAMLAAIMWIQAMAEQFRDRAWGFLALFIVLPFGLVGYVGWLVTK